MYNYMQQYEQILRHKIEEKKYNSINIKHIKDKIYAERSQRRG
jgi:hypothetical protein